MVDISPQTPDSRFVVTALSSKLAFYWGTKGQHMSFHIPGSSRRWNFSQLLKRTLTYVFVAVVFWNRSLSRSDRRTNLYSPVPRASQSDGGLYPCLNILVGLLNVVFIQRLTTVIEDSNSATNGELHEGEHKINKKRLTCNGLKVMLISHNRLLTVTSASYTALCCVNSCTSTAFELPPKSLI